MSDYVLMAEDYSSTVQLRITGGGRLVLYGNGLIAVDDNKYLRVRFHNGVQCM